MTSAMISKAGPGDGATAEGVSELIEAFHIASPLAVQGRKAG